MNVLIRRRRFKVSQGVTVAIACALLLGGCIFLPRTSTVYDADCEVYERKMTLEAYQVASLVNCDNETCMALLVATGVVSTATAVVSGSVVVAGNVVYWLEKKGRCNSQKEKPQSS